MTRTVEEAVGLIEEAHLPRPIAAQVAAAIVDPDREDVVSTALPIVVGITGYAQNGKDTVGSLFVSAGFKQYAFADALKSMALTLNPLIDVSQHRGLEGYWRLADLVETLGWEIAKKNPEVRRFLQVLGTEAVREHLGEESWVNALAHKIAKDGTRKAVVTDVRFPNEANWVRSQRGKLIRVKRLNPDGTEFDNGVDRSHGSEKFVSTLPIDFEITASSVDELDLKARRVLREVAT